MNLQLSDAIECEICFSNFIQTNLCVLICGHHLCEHCYEKIQKDDYEKRICPFCRKALELSPTPSFAMKSMMNLVNSMCKFVQPLPDIISVIPNSEKIPNDAERKNDKPLPKDSQTILSSGYPCDKCCDTFIIGDTSGEDPSEILKRNASKLCLNCKNMVYGFDIEKYIPISEITIIPKLISEKKDDQLDMNTGHEIEEQSNDRSHHQDEELSLIGIDSREYLNHISQKKVNSQSNQMEDVSEKSNQIQMNSTVNVVMNFSNGITSHPNILKKKSPIKKSEKNERSSPRKENRRVSFDYNLYDLPIAAMQEAKSILTNETSVTSTESLEDYSPLSEKDSKEVMDNDIMKKEIKREILKKLKKKSKEKRKRIQDLNQEEDFILVNEKSIPKMGSLIHPNATRTCWCSLNHNFAEFCGACKKYYKYIEGDSLDEPTHSCYRKPKELIKKRPRKN